MKQEQERTAHPGSNSAKSAVSTLTTTSGGAAVPLPSAGGCCRSADSAAPTAVFRSRSASSWQTRRRGSCCLRIQMQLLKPHRQILVHKGC